MADFAELEARLSSLPPAVLRPRRVAEDFHVCAVASAEQVHFDAPSQTVLGVLVDVRGRQALLSHPYTTRGGAGAETLLARLSAAPKTLRFVSGAVRRTAAGLVIHPACLVWQGESGRAAIQPWIARGTNSEEGEGGKVGLLLPSEPLADYLRQLQARLAEVLVLGLQRVDGQFGKRWRELQHQGEAVGFGRLAGRVAALAEALEQKGHTLNWELHRAGGLVLELLVLARLAADIAG
jgi:hypothetical protein